MGVQIGHVQIGSRIWKRTGVREKGKLLRSCRRARVGAGALPHHSHRVRRAARGRVARRAAARRDAPGAALRLLRARGPQERPATGRATAGAREFAHLAQGARQAAAAARCAASLLFLEQQARVLGEWVSESYVSGMEEPGTGDTSHRVRVELSQVRLYVILAIQIRGFFEKEKVLQVGASRRTRARCSRSGARRSSRSCSTRPTTRSTVSSSLLSSSAAPVRPSDSAQASSRGTLFASYRRTVSARANSGKLPCWCARATWTPRAQRYNGARTCRSALRWSARSRSKSYAATRDTAFSPRTRNCKPPARRCELPAFYETLCDLKNSHRVKIDTVWTRLSLSLSLSLVCVYATSRAS